MSLPYAWLLEIAFTTGPLDPLPDWIDVTSRLRAASWRIGKTDPKAVIEPGTASFTLDSDDGAFLQDYPLGPYYGYLIENRRVRLSIQETSSDPMVQVWSGFADTWTPAREGGADAVEVVLACTDRFKLLTKRTNTGTTVQENASARLKAILDNGDTGGVNAIIIPAEYELYPGSYASRDVVAHIYTGGDTLSNIDDVVRSDGGWAFVDGEGVFVFQPYSYRTGAFRATTSQATFGNTTGAVPVVSDLDPASPTGELANYLTLTDGAGTVATVQDATSQDDHGRQELDLGATLLVPADAASRLADALALYKDPRPRLQALTVDCAADDLAAEQALARQISDRVTVENIPGDLDAGVSRDYWIDSIGQTVDLAAGVWDCTFTLSGTTDAAVVIYP